MRVTWDKRYITLAPVCTLLGLAFRLFDPDGLLGGRKDLGITCALVPHDHPGVDTGRRHLPLNGAFTNGPTRGREVFMPFDFIIGGPERIGQGWRMLMECLAAGRGISLPSSNTGMAKITARAVGGYARVRSQFNMAIGRFEGIEEPLARMEDYDGLRWLRDRSPVRIAAGENEYTHWGFRELVARRAVPCQAAPARHNARYAGASPGSDGRPDTPDPSSVLAA